MKITVQILAVVLLIVAIVLLISFCNAESAPETTHKCESICDTCGKCKDYTCSENECKDKCDGDHINLPDIDIGDLN